MSIYKISLSDAQADKLADWLSNTRGEVDSRIAEEIRAQIPKPAVEEPTAFGSIVRAVCAHGTEYQLWQRSPMQGKHYWESEHGIVEVWSDLTHVEVLRVGIGEPAVPTDADEFMESTGFSPREEPGGDAASYCQGRDAFAAKVRREVSALRAAAIGAERKDAYDTALALVGALLGES